MYEIVYTKRFSKSYKKLIRGGFTKRATARFAIAVRELARSGELSKSFKDHQLQGVLAPYREFHLQGDLLVMYVLNKKEDVVVLVDIGTHAQLFG